MSNVSVGPKERTVWFGDSEGNRERYDETDLEVEKKSVWKISHVCSGVTGLFSVTRWPR